ncbi:MAG: ATP-binding cassette domain-containing protein, partial [Gammaproteobacteria bacterium]|nr:ATP-binding cassette domain-containing protein [Gammaproteobacteria bacterium]
MDILSVRQVSKRYRARSVVNGVAMDIKSGEVVGLLGPNGAGKTTCFYMIVGLIPCDTGSISLNETDITAFPMHARARLGIGYLPQEPSVFRKLSVADNVRAILQTRRDLDRAG